MFIYNKDKSKLSDILNEEGQLKKDLERLNKNNQQLNSNICDFKSIFLQNKINKLHSEIKNIMLGKSDNDNNIA